MLGFAAASTQARHQRISGLDVGLTGAATPTPACTDTSGASQPEDWGSDQHRRPKAWSETTLLNRHLAL